MFALCKKMGLLVSPRMVTNYSEVVESYMEDDYSEVAEPYMKDDYLASKGRIITSVPIVRGIES